MTPKEKAEELVYKFKKYAYYPKTDDDRIFMNQLIKNAKQCAIIAVDEIIDNYEEKYKYCTTKIYWEEVKQEIENL